MSARPRRLMPPAAGETHIERLGHNEFARRLASAMNAKGWTQSDLAREMWGEVASTDKKGRTYMVAKNRDRIGSYLRGRGYPGPENLQRLAELLGMTVNELAPEVGMATIDREHPEFSIVVVGDHAHIQINAMIPLSDVLAFAQLYQRVKDRRLPAPGVDYEDDNQADGRAKQ